MQILEKEKPNDWDVILTIHNEFFFRWEAEKYHCDILRIATDKESDSYKYEWFYWQGVTSDNY